MSLPFGGPDKQPHLRGTASTAPSSMPEPDNLANFQPQDKIRDKRQGSLGGQFLSWQITAEPAKPRQEDEEDQRDPGLLFITNIGQAGLQPRERKRVRSHVMQRYVHKRKEKTVEENRKHARGGLQLRPHIDLGFGAGGVDPFNTLPVRMSGSNSRLLEYFVQHIAPLHYPCGRGEAEHNPMTTTWIATALTDTALLHSTLSSSSGHMLYYANLPAMSPLLLPAFLSHKAETIRIINERMGDSSKALTDGTLGAIALLITGQTCQGDYNEMNVHMRGLTQLVGLRGGLETLGMSGLLAGEILWCDNVTAFVSSAKPLLVMPEITNNPFESFEDPEVNLFLAGRKHNSSSALWTPALRQILSDGLIAALQSLHIFTAFLETSPTLSEHDMIVYDRKRASIQHQIADVAIPPFTLDIYHITESCRLAAVIYSITTLWGFQPPMNLYGDLAKMLQKALQATDNVCRWGPWSSMLLWTLFIGGYAAFGRQERLWFATRVGEATQRQNLSSWRSVRDFLTPMPVCQALWGPFEILWWEAADVALGEDVAATADGGQILAM